MLNPSILALTVSEISAFIRTDSASDPVHEYMYNVQCFFHYYTHTEGKTVSVRSLQRREGHVSDPIQHMYF